MRGSHGWQRWVFDSHRSAPSFARVRLESRLAGGSGIPSHLPAPGGKSEPVCPKSLAALRRKGYAWRRRARGEGSGGEVEKALISQKELALDLKAMRVWLFESQRYINYVTCAHTAHRRREVDFIFYVRVGSRPGSVGRVSPMVGQRVGRVGRSAGRVGRKGR